MTVRSAGTTVSRGGALASRQHLATVGSALVILASIAGAVWAAADLDRRETVIIGLFAVVAASAGAALAGALLQSRTGPVPVAVPPPAFRPTTDSPPIADEALVRRVLEVRDLLDNPALCGRLDQGLREAGFEVIVPEPGEPFDVDTHMAVDTETVRGGATPGTIAATEQIGLVRDGRLHRRASVVVWKESS